MIFVFRVFTGTVSPGIICGIRYPIMITWVKPSFRVGMRRVYNDPVENELVFLQNLLASGGRLIRQTVSFEGDTGVYL